VSGGGAAEGDAQTSQQAEEAESPEELAARELQAERENLARAAEAGIHRLAIPTPFMVGRVNAYLIEDSPLTLIDSGPNSAKALDELEQELAKRGHRIEDIELLVISHQHMDHFGLASILARRSGAEVATIGPLAPYLAAYSSETDLDDAFAESIMLRHGIPREVVTALRAVSAGFRAWGSPVEVTRPLGDGEELELGERTLRVLHRPGHSPSDTIFLDERRGMLLAADHLIAHISSNPLLARPLGAEPENGGPPTPRPQALITYMRSLEATRELQLELVLPGHGRPITDHVTLIDERFRMHRRRAERILRLLSDGPRTAHEIAQELWGNVAVTQAYLTLSEVLGHADLLLADGRAVEEERDGVVRFAAADA
jgi:glyoxylase-like metal-dependent hydrolase (beta-lactamase superfamily II)